MVITGLFKNHHSLTYPYRKKDEAYLVLKLLCYQHFNGTSKINKCLQNKV